MKREIKFRARRWDNKEFCYGSIIMIIDPTIEETTYNNAFMHGGVNISPTVRVDIETVGEYTGLKDKNGKEIYEGDYFNERISTTSGFKDRTFTIVWDDEYAAFTIQPDGVDEESREITKSWMEEVEIKTP